ncbi:ABC transporter permease [Enterococcus sp. LJL98]
MAFLLINLSPIDPIKRYILMNGAVTPEQQAQLVEYWGLNLPPVTRYFEWLTQALQGNLGESFLYRQPVSQVLLERFMNTFGLMMTAWLFSLLLGYVLGCLMGVKEGSLLDRCLKKTCLILSSVPTFWLGMLFLSVFAVKLQWLPIGFSRPIGATTVEVSFLARVKHLILPAITLSLTSFSGLALQVRQKMIQVLRSDYVLFSRARGYNDWEILKRHGLKGTIIPAVTIQFMSFAELFGGSILAETVFSYPGLGSAITAAGLNGDVSLLLGITVFSTIFVFFGNLMADYVVLKVDRRIGEGVTSGT